MFSLAIIGRPNVGKSTLFNLMAGKQLAIVNDTPGLTRDWRTAETRIGGYPVELIDTAGLEDAFDDSIRARMREQTEAAIQRADAVLFVIDGRAGLTPLDEHFAGWLRKQKVPVILCVNKSENQRAAAPAQAEAYRLGFGEPIAVSAAHAMGIDEIIARVLPLAEEAHTESHEEVDEEDIDAGFIADLDELEGDEDFDFAEQAGEDEEEDPETPIKMAIVGRPNVGKSTLLNALVGEQRVMTGPEAGITRDAIAVRWEYEGRNFKLVDTAGMRRKAKIVEDIEKMSVEDSLRAIRLAQVVILVIDATQLLRKQDLSIAQHVISEGRALIIAVNKWDQVEEPVRTVNRFHEQVGTSLAQVKDIPYMTMSALTGKNVGRIMDLVLEVYKVWNARVPTGRLNRWLKMMESRHPAPLVQGRPNRIKYMTQIKTRPPTFALWVSVPKKLPKSYKRYIANGIREDFGMPGVPIRLLVRTTKNPYK